MGQSDNPPCPSSALLINYAGPLPISLLVDPSARGARSPSSAATPVWARESRLPLVLGFPRNQLSRRRPTSAFPWPGRDPLALRGLPGGRCAEDHPCLAALGARDQGKGSAAPQACTKGLLRGVVYGATAVALLFLRLIPLIVKHIRRRQAKRSAAIKAGESPPVGASHEPKLPLRPEELEKSQSPHLLRPGPRTLYPKLPGKTRKAGADEACENDMHPWSPHYPWTHQSLQTPYRPQKPWSP